MYVGRRVYVVVVVDEYVEVLRADGALSTALRSRFFVFVLLWFFWFRRLLIFIVLVLGVFSFGF